MAKAERLPFHELVSLFDPMTGADFDGLVADIEEHGLRDPIVKFKGEIVDGRNRYNACLKAKVEPFFVEWDEQGSLVAFILSANLHRRHMNETQRAMLGSRIKELQGNAHGGDRKSDKNPEESQENQVANLPLETIAASLNVSERSIRTADAVRESCSVGVQEAVSKGEISVSDAASVADLPKVDQTIALKAVKAGKAKTLAQAAGVKPPSKSKQHVEGRKTTGTKPPPNPKPTGVAKKAHEFIGKLSRAVDDIAREQKWPKPVRDDIHKAIDAVKQKIIKAEGAK